MSLFDSNHKYTSESLQVDREVQAALKPIFVKCIEAGHSPREISHIMIHAVTMLEAMLMVRKKSEPSKNE